MIALPSKVFSRKHFILVSDSRSRSKSVRPECMVSLTSALVVYLYFTTLTLLKQPQNLYNQVDELVLFL